MVKNYYDVMGVGKKAGADEIKKAYRRLAKKYHPDVSREHNAEHKFKEIQEAYDTLKDPAKRENYDLGGGRGRTGGHQGYRQQRPGGGQGPWGQAGAGSSGYGDFFQNMFGDRAAQQQPQSKPGVDYHTSIDLTLNEVLAGGKKVVVVHVPEVNHHGDRQSLPKKMTVNIPKAIRPGQKIRLKDQGENRAFNGKKGNLYLTVNVLPSKPYYMKQHDVYVDVPLAPWEAALGCTVLVPTLKGDVELKIAEGTQGGKKMRLKGRGMPAVGKLDASDVFAVIQIVTPMPELKKEKEFYNKMAKTFNFNPRANWPV
ncbi:MAG: DnaJ domain-containing protein [Methylococcales bacterium]|nr:DnaJ domain-containing protein [Methylococcales bacterium]